MRIVVFFDLPTLTSENMKAYRQFRNSLIKNGFIMMQESVYCRMVLNQSAAKSCIDTLRKIKPNDGLIQILTITEKQFAKMEYLIGSQNTEIVDSDERLVII